MLGRSSVSDGPPSGNVRLAGRRRACVTLVAVVVLAARAAGPAHAIAPTSTTITLDGEFADWSLVLENPANAARDGDGTIRCELATDRDSQKLLSIRKLIRERPGITQREVMRVLHIRKPDFEEYLETLIASGEVTKSDGPRGQVFLETT